MGKPEAHGHSVITQRHDSLKLLLYIKLALFISPIDALIPTIITWDYASLYLFKCHFNSTASTSGPHLIQTGNHQTSAYLAPLFHKMSSYNPIPSDFTPEGHADPEGDVIFSLDTEGTLNDGQPHLLKVSSQTMSRASRAFNGMFNPRFTGRADFSPNDPLEIALPEDDYQAMTWICFALHLQDLPEGRIPLALLKEIALLADKYNLALNLQPWSSLWLHEWSGSSADDESYWELLWMAYALLDFQMFYEASQKLIYGKAMEDPDFDSEGLDDVGFSLLPAGIKGQLLICLQSDCCNQRLRFN